MSADPTFILFGATGDLCGRHLIPALARLSVADELPAGFRVLGTGPEHFDEAAFRDHVRTRLATFAPDLATAGVEAFIDRLSYRAADVQDPTAVGELVGLVPAGAPVFVYLALPTQLMAAAVEALHSNGLPVSVRIAVEKPFGEDLASARDLNVALARTTSDESHIFRVDHFLGMPTIQAVSAAVRNLRRKWVAEGSEVEKVSILWEETLALEGRAAFYDRAGALKDLLQNHLVQILCQVLQDDSPAPPGGWSERRLRALQTVRVPTAEQARSRSRRARYTAGTLLQAGGGAPTEVPDYVDEHGVDGGRNTETFAQLSLFVDNGEWTDAEFVLRSGKAMRSDRRGILFELRAGSSGSAAEDEWIDFDQPPADAPVEPHPAIESAPLEQGAYITVLRDVLAGSTALSVSREETELAWRIFTPVLQEWAAGTVPLESYRAGTSPATVDRRDPPTT